MLPLRVAIILILAGGASSALADQITCESRQGDGAQACGTIQQGSSIRLVRQLSASPCVAGRNWGTGANHDSIWVSGGCRAVFDVQPPYNGTADRAPEAQRDFNDSQQGTPDGRADSRDNGYRADRNAARNDDDADNDAQNPSENDRQDEPRSDQRRVRPGAAQNDDQDSDAPYPSNGDRRDEPRDNAPPLRDDNGPRHANADHRVPASVRRACIDEAASGQKFGPDQVTAFDERRIGHGLFAIGLDTPDGPATCTVDRDGNVKSIDSR